MKIIKIGNAIKEIPEWWEDMVLTCGRCETQFSLEKGDKVESYSERRLNGISMVKALCPHCGNLVIGRTH